MLDEQVGGGASGDQRPTPRTRGGRRSGGGAALAAAMLAVGDILEPQKTEVEIAVEADADGLPFDLDFGDLPPI